jgi:hypothetical protein
LRQRAGFADRMARCRFSCPPIISPDEPITDNDPDLDIDLDLGLDVDLD